MVRYETLDMATIFRSGRRRFHPTDGDLNHTKFRLSIHRGRGATPQRTSSQTLRRSENIYIYKVTAGYIPGNENVVGGNLVAG